MNRTKAITKNATIIMAKAKSMALNCCRPVALLVLLSAHTMLGHNAAAQEWTRFRGPNGTGESDATSIPSKWDSSDYNWVVDLPGIGHSSPVIWGERIFLQSADPDSGTQYLLCLNSVNGEAVWRKEIDAKSYHIHTRNSFASSTPAVDDAHVYITFATPDQIRVYAFDHAGTEVWSRQDLGPYASQHGWGSSPIVVEDMLVVSNLQMPSKEHGAETSAVYAVNKNTGEEIWTSPRTSGKASYSVPCVRETKAGPELILCSTTHGMFGLDLKTGKENWSAKDVFSMRTVSSPVVVGKHVFGSNGSGAGGNYVVAIDLESRAEAFRVAKQAPYVPTPVANGDLLFLWYDKGIVTCIDANTNQQHWSKRVGGNYSGSPVRVGKHIYCIGEDGTVVVLAASEKYQLVSKVPLGEDSRSTPAISDGKLYLRTYSKLFSLGG